MKKMLLIVAVAFAAISCCGNKCEGQKCCEGEAAAVEAVEAPAEEEAAPAEEVAEPAAEVPAEAE